MDFVNECNFFQCFSCCSNLTNIYEFLLQKCKVSKSDGSSLSFPETLNKNTVALLT
jgi:hypothetical protein